MYVLCCVHPGENAPTWDAAVTRLAWLEIPVTYGDVEASVADGVSGQDSTEAMSLGPSEAVLCRTGSTVGLP